MMIMIDGNVNSSPARISDEFLLMTSVFCSIFSRR